MSEKNVNAEQPGRRFVLRATYIERDRLALLSHLEVAHALERTVRRADCLSPFRKAFRRI